MDEFATSSGCGLDAEDFYSCHWFSESLSLCSLSFALAFPAVLEGCYCASLHDIVGNIGPCLALKLPSSQGTPSLCLPRVLSPFSALSQL